MKITAIKPFPVWVGHRNQLILKIETDEGIYGWGESGLSGREKAVIGAIEHFREFLLGRDPMRIGAIWQELYRSQYFEGGRVLLERGWNGVRFFPAAWGDAHNIFERCDPITCPPLRATATSLPAIPPSGGFTPLVTSAACRRPFMRNRSNP